IDPLRESLVMSLAMHVGPRGDLLLGDDAADEGGHVHLPGPLLPPHQLEALLGWTRQGWRPRRLSLLFPAAGGAAAFRGALDSLLAEAALAVREGAGLLVLSDRGVDAGHAALPSLLAVSAVHQHLVREGLRTRVSLAAETAEARDDHQVAALVTFGAEVVCPYLALAAVRVAAHFTGTARHLGGAGLDEIAGEVLSRHRAAFTPGPAGLEEGSLHRYRQKGEAHAFEPPVVKALHGAIRAGERLDYRR